MQFEKTYGWIKANRWRLLGLSLIIAAIAAALVVMSMANQLAEYAHATCNLPEGICPFRGYIPPQAYAGYTIALIIGIVGVFLIYAGGTTQKEAFGKIKDKEKTIKALPQEEKAVYDIISGSEGLVLQSELVEKTNLSKVRITRLLDRLESKGLVERRRRGMSNIIMLK